jgi:SAM-dependent methyltransferase
MDTNIDVILSAWRGGEVSSHLALMELLALERDFGRVASALAARSDDASPGAYAELLCLLMKHREGAERVVRIIDTVGRHGVDAATDGVVPTPIGIERVAALFDEVVGESAEASVALYCLGDPAVLERATNEVVDCLQTRGCFDRAKDVLDIGCGIGRFEMALAGLVRSLHGIDVSPAMIARARRDATHLENVHFDVANGRDLAKMTDESFDLVLAVDSMPYIVAADTVESMFAEIARVLRPDGELVVCNFSYRGDLGEDRADAARFGAKNGLDIVENGDSPFSLWNAPMFRWKRRRAVQST